MQDIWSKHPILSKINVWNFSRTDFVAIHFTDQVSTVIEKLENALLFNFRIFLGSEELASHVQISEVVKRPEIPDLIPKLKLFNDRLCEVTELLKQERIRSLQLFEELKANTNSKYEVDYEPEYCIDFYLKESDALFNDDIDNIFLSIPHKGIMPHSAKIVSMNCNDIEEANDYLNGEYFKSLTNINVFPEIENQGRLFYQLYYHNIVSPQDMIRTGNIWLDFHHVNQIAFL